MLRELLDGFTDPVDPSSMVVEAIVDLPNLVAVRLRLLVRSSDGARTVDPPNGGGSSRNRETDHDGDDFGWNGGHGALKFDRFGSVQDG
jgi:hypothetical protein